MLLDVTRPQTPLALYCRDRVHRLRRAKFTRGDLGQAEVAYFPGRDHFGHRADGLFDGDVGVATMHVPQVDDVDAQTAQRRLACLTHVLGIAPGALRLGVIDGSDTPGDPEFRCQSDLVTPVGEEPAYQLFVGARRSCGAGRGSAVDVGGVDEGDAFVDGGVQHSQRRCVVGAAVHVGQRHSAESQGRRP